MNDDSLSFSERAKECSERLRSVTMRAVAKELSGKVKPGE
jgi:hypothetical protein